MEDSFKVRVDRVFGSLLHSLPTKPSSPWTLSDAEIERKEWNRDKGDILPDREDVPCSSSFDGFFSSEKKTKKHRNPNSSRGLGKEIEGDLDDGGGDDDDDDVGQDGEKDRSAAQEDYDREDWEIRNSIGLDSTLDHEDEEDEYDKVAVGSENAGDRLYMRDITDYGPYLNCHNVLPDSFEEVKTARRDPRANHLAAKARLQEDETAGSFNSLLAHDDEMPAIVDSQAKSSKDGGNVKSILKRKDNQVDSRSKKRVRFDPGCKDDHDGESEQAQDFPMVSRSMETTATIAEASDKLLVNDPRVPDYIRNPSKYVCYTFDSSNEDEDEFNRHAYKDFCNTIVNMSASVQPDNAASLPKSVTFTPRRKAGSAVAMNDGSEIKQSHEDASMESVQRVICPISIAAAEAQESEACVMEEDDLETSRVEKSIGFCKSDRQYRSKVSSDDSIS